MTRERLQSIPLEELETLARNEGYEFTGATNRSVLIDFILENYDERKREREEENNPSIRVEESKYEITDGEAFYSGDQESYPIPERYPQTKIVLMVRDPNWAFAYWDMEDHLLEKLKRRPDTNQLVLRVHDVELVDFDGRNSNSFFDIPIQLSDTSWYIYLPNQNCSYILELGCITNNKYICLARSNTINTPRDSVSEGFSPSAGDGELPFSLYPEPGSFKAYASSEGIPQRILSVAGD
jgi:hypothetical protein